MFVTRWTLMEIDTNTLIEIKFPSAIVRTLKLLKMEV